MGWSPSGSFAYVYELPDEACGCSMMRLVVQDMITDRVLWEHGYRSDEIQPGRAARPTDMRT